MKLFSLPAASALAVCLLGVGAQANTNNNEPGSLLVFPLFENESGTATLITVTNTNPDVVTGTVKVEYIYINGDNCLEFNRTRTLTANDTLTVVTGLDNPNMQEGYLYVFAKGASGPNNNRAIAFDWLIGAAAIFETEECAVSYGPVVFSAGLRIAEGAPTDKDNDNIRDLNGTEYEQVPDELLVPRFFGQVNNHIETELILVNLTGGSAFTALVNFLIYNDNEEVFSAQVSFDCWAEYELSEINNVFDNSFLLTTGHAAGETSGIVVTATNPDSIIETGWYRMDGAIAFSSAASFNDPAILALQVEEVGDNELATLPFSTGSQNNGDLLPHGIFGDQN